MKKTHWKKLHNPDYLGAYSLVDEKTGEYNDLTVTIKTVRVEEVVGTDGKRESCMVAHFNGGHKPMIINATNAKTLEKLFKTPFIEEWGNRSVSITVKAVKAFGEVVDALRFKNHLPKPAEMPKCADTGAAITATERMTAEQVVAWTMKRYGRPLCAARATELAQAEKSTEAEQAETAETESVATESAEVDGDE